MEIETAVIVAIITFAGGGIAAGVTYLLGLRKAVAEPAKLLANGYSKFSDDLQSQIATQRERIDELQRQIDMLSANMRGLTEENSYLRERLATADARILALESEAVRQQKEITRLRTENRKLGEAAEQMRCQLLAASAGG